ncbi:MAG: hypothetical protein QOD71_2984 [Thermoleophilaceae bacterium]|nr:hypothetical protein [Thermoleophilaceae bacterium]
MFFEESPRRSLPRPSPPWILAASILAAGGAGVAALLTRDSPPEPLAAVPAARAERRLEHQLGTGEGAGGSVRCPSPIRPGHATRCQFLYENGDTRLMLVTLMANGTLDIEVPYPAQRRPSG